MPRQRLIECRRNKQWTQRRVGELVGLTKQAVSDIERGRRNPSYKVAQRLETTFGVEHHELLAEHE